MADVVEKEPQETEKLDNNDVLAFRPSGNLFADDATQRACKMLETGLQARQPRFDQIRKNEDMVNGVVGPALKGRSNVPFDTVVMTGFLDTLQAGMSEDFSVHFGHKREQGKMAADKMRAVFERESASDRGAWTEKVMEMKNLAGVSGRGFLKLACGNVPKFQAELSVCDHYDMVTEAMGGSDLNKHLYKFQQNIFLTKKQLLDGVAGGWYDRGQTRALIVRYTDEGWYKKFADMFQNKLARYAAFGIDINAHSYVGQNVYRMNEGVINIDGDWYYIVFSYEMKTWIRFQRLEEVFDHAKQVPGMGPWASFATNPHAFIFWTKGPADDIRPIAYTMKKIVNLTLDNLEKRNWQQRAYDPKIFTDPTQLAWRQDGIVKATLPAGKNIAQGIYEFQTPDTTGITINLANWLDQFLGQKTGITDAAQGQSTVPLATIQISNIQATSKRMTLKSKMYRQMLVNLGIMFDYGTYQYLREDYAVKLIGNDGIKWNEDVTRKDLEEEFDISVTSELEENEKNAAVVGKMSKFYGDIAANPILLGQLNPQEYIREYGKFSGVKEEKLRKLLDKQNDGDETVMAQAAQAIQMILDGVEFIPTYPNATTGFVEKIRAFAESHYQIMPDSELKRMLPSKRNKYHKDMEMFDKLIVYASQHVAIAQQNMQRKLVQGLAAGGALGPGAPQPGGAPAGGTGAPQPSSAPAPTPPILPGAAGGPQAAVARAQ